MKSRLAMLVFGLVLMTALGACTSDLPRIGARVCPEVATVAPGGNQTFRLCRELVADSLIQWTTPGPGFVTQGRYHAPLVVPASVSVIIQATPERWTGVPSGRATVFLTAGSVPGVDSCTGPAQDHLPMPGEYVYVEELPEPIQKVPPEYPDIARAHGIEGTVLVSALVCADGTIIDAYMIKSIPELDGAAEQAVRQWIFQPARTGGLPVAVWVAIPVRFTLNEAERAYRGSSYPR